MGAAAVRGVVVNAIGPGQVVLRVEVVPIALTERGLKRIIALISVVIELHDVLVGWSQSATDVGLENGVEWTAAIKGRVVARTGTSWRACLLSAIFSIPTSKRAVIQASLVKKVLPPRPDVGKRDDAVLEQLVLDGGGVVVNSGRKQGRDSTKDVERRISCWVRAERLKRDRASRQRPNTDEVGIGSCRRVVASIRPLSLKDLSWVGSPRRCHREHAQVRVGEGPSARAMEAIGRADGGEVGYVVGHCIAEAQGSLGIAEDIPG